MYCTQSMNSYVNCIKSFTLFYWILTAFVFTIVSHSNSRTDGLQNPGGRSVQCIGLSPLTCWDCGFESRRGHICSFFVNVVCCTGTGLCHGPISRPGESYRVCMCPCVWTGDTKTLYTYNEQVEEARLKKLQLCDQVKCLQPNVMTAQQVEQSVRGSRMPSSVFKWIRENKDFGTTEVVENM